MRKCMQCLQPHPAVHAQHSASPYGASPHTQPLNARAGHTDASFARSCILSCVSPWSCTNLCVLACHIPQICTVCHVLVRLDLEACTSSCVLVVRSPMAYKLRSFGSMRPAGNAWGQMPTGSLQWSSTISCSSRLAVRPGPLCGIEG
jgi:hypothetical protein